MIVDKKQLQPYLDGNADLIPLHIWNKQTKKKGKVQERGKTPLFPDWTKAPKNINKVLELVDKSHNVGYRLSDTDFIIDIDHRNFKDDVDSLAELCKFLEIEDLAEICPTVITGSGGFHYYMHKPSDMNIRETIERFPGIEFKVKGRQVVTAGSKHPNGNYYEWDDFSPPYGEQPKAPKKLLNILKYEVPENQAVTGTINNDQLSRLLDQLPIEQYANYDDYFKIICASHHGTAGLGVDEFVNWALGNPDYADHEHGIRYKWASLHGKDINITVNSLYKEVLAHGGDTATITAQEDFEGINDFKDELDEEHDPSLDDDFDDIISKPDVKESYKAGIATQLANTLHIASSEEDIIKAIRSSLQAGTIEQIKSLGIIQTNLKWTKGQLNEVIKQIKEQIIDDLGRILAEKTMELKFYKKKGLVFAANGQFWQYNGKFWSVASKQFIGKKITEVLDNMRKKIDINVRENALVTESVSIIERLAAVDKDVLRLRERPHPVINCTNGELWIRKDGTTKLLAHKPGSYLLQLLNVEFSPGAQCPLFDKSIRETFNNFDDAEDIVRHFEEYMGYVLHPDKRPAKFWLFKGPGGDGKTTLLKILSGLLGNAVLPESIDSFKKGSGADNHAFADLPGILLIYDDDMSKNSMLPDGPLKKLSEDGELTANPKGHPKFKFVKACTTTMLSNGYPKTKDLTRGFRRRAMVIPFDRAFHEKGAIYDLADKIIRDELAGVLNRALEGLQRVRERGDFIEPESCRVAREVWMSESNNVALFMREKVTVTHSERNTITLSDMYSSFTDWCISYGINRVETKQQFRGMLEDIGVWYGKLGSNKSGFKGVTIIEENITDFEDDFGSDFEDL